MRINLILILGKTGIAITFMDQQDLAVFMLDSSSTYRIPNQNFVLSLNENKREYIVV